MPGRESVQERWVEGGERDRQGEPWYSQCLGGRVYTRAMGGGGGKLGVREIDRERGDGRASMRWATWDREREHERASVDLHSP
jgi:hypothetical protein